MKNEINEVSFILYIDEYAKSDRNIFLAEKIDKPEVNEALRNLANQTLKNIQYATVNLFIDKIRTIIVSSFIHDFMKERVSFGDISCSDMDVMTEKSLNWLYKYIKNDKEQAFVRKIERELEDVIEAIERFR